MAGVPPLLGFVAKESFYADAARRHAFLRRIDRCVQALVLAASLVDERVPGGDRRQARRSASSSGPSAARRTAGTDAAAAAIGCRCGSSPLVLALARSGSGSLGLGPLHARAGRGDRVSRPAPGSHVSLVPHARARRFCALARWRWRSASSLYRAARRGRRARRRGSPCSRRRRDVWERLDRGDRAPRRGVQHALAERLAALVPGRDRARAAGAAASTRCASAGSSWRDVALSLAEMPWYGLLFCVLLAVATMAAVRARTRLAAAIASTTIGFLVSMLFVVYRSPDILLTQILIETVSTIFVLLVLVFLPPFPRARPAAAVAQLVNVGIAGGVRAHRSRCCCCWR